MYAKLEYYKYLICKASEIFMRKKFAWLLVFCLIFSSPAVCLRAVGGTPADVETKSHETTDHPPDLGLTFQGLYTDGGIYRQCDLCAESG